MATVLLVEDDPAARQGLELALRRLGYMVRAAETGEAALRDFRDAAADVVVLDLMLPGLDGFEVCRRLRRGSDIPVIMLTARGDDLDIVGGLEAGADDYVVKPVEPRVLDARIRAIIRRTARAGSPAETYGELLRCYKPMPGREPCVGSWGNRLNSSGCWGDCWEFTWGGESYGRRMS